MLYGVPYLNGTKGTCWSPLRLPRELYNIDWFTLSHPTIHLSLYQLSYTTFSFKLQAILAGTRLQVFWLSPNFCSLSCLSSIQFSLSLAKSKCLRVAYHAFVGQIDYCSCLNRKGGEVSSVFDKIRSMCFSYLSQVKSKWLVLWLVLWNIIGFQINPTDELTIFQRGGSITNQPNC